MGVTMAEDEIARDDIPEDGEAPEPKKKSKLPLILGVVLALAGGGGGFFVMSSGMLGGGSDDPAMAEESHDEQSVNPLPDVAFVELSPMVISIGQTGAEHLRFMAQLEVPSAYRDEVEGILPRIIDVLNSYLRAVDVEELADRAALARLRAQMLRRVQIVTGKGRVRDLLIMEFVVN